MPDARRGSLWERFWSKVRVDEATGCWLWIGGIGQRRRGGVDGRLRRGGKTAGFVSPHRQVCEWTHGPAPSTLHQAAHSCDVNLCCNPAHLRWATQSENERDKQFVDEAAVPF